MGMSTNLNAYRDVKAVLDTAYKNGGGEYELPTPAKATQWRHRAYYFRKLFIKSVDGNPTIYDNLVFRKEAGSSVIIIAIQEQEGVMRTPGGEVVEPEPVTAAESYEANGLMPTDSDVALGMLKLRRKS